MAITNQQRAEFASLAIDEYRGVSGTGGVIIDDVLVEFLADIMHLIDRFDVPDPNATFADFAERAKQRYETALEENPDLCGRDIEAHTCIRPAGHGGYHACGSTCELGHLRENQLADDAAVLEYRAQIRSKHPPIYLR